MTHNLNSVRVQQLRQLLSFYWGYADFRDLQLEIIDSVLAGRDTLGIMATGAGKSLCYQMLPIYAQQFLDGGIAVVISPLVSLMYEQVQSFNYSLAVRLGWRSDYFAEAQGGDKLWQDLANGRVRLLYLSPERICQPDYRERLQQLPVRYLCVDEAHCVLTWGQDFRPDYCHLAGLRPDFPRATWLALSATVALADRAELTQALGLAQPTLCVGNFLRPNLSFRLHKTQDKLGFLSSFLRKHTLNSQQSQAGIIYAHSRARVMQLSNLLKAQGLAVEAYHAGMDRHDRKFIQDRWLYNRGTPRLKVLVSTNALGMGIDKADTRFVIHDSPPANLIEYYQQAGRAGRDGLYAQAILLYDDQDVRRLHKLCHSRILSIAQMNEIYQEMLAYLKTSPQSFSPENAMNYSFACEGFLQFSDFYADRVPQNTPPDQIRQFCYGLLLRHVDILQRLGLLQRGLRASHAYYVKLYGLESQFLAAQTADSPLLEEAMEWLLRKLPADDRGQLLPLDSLSRYLRKSQAVVVKVLHELAGRALLTLTHESREELWLTIHARLRQDFMHDARLRRKLEQIHAELQKPYQQMLNYLTQPPKCRSQYLAQQFSEVKQNRCGICDQCL